MNLFELFVKVGVDDQASGKLKDLGGKLGNGLATAAKIGTAAVGAAAAGITALTKAAVDNYAEYEQLVGGVETLFKGSADTVQQYASEAFRTAGLSANQYMETVTSFSASLLQSLGGDTDAAAKKADVAITDMADNANKMGTSIEMLQTAYAGFAKQNFTMLDNLKLGYGGTKEEMQRLLDDASKISGIKYDISSFADITDAIHVMQEEMGIAGATALEAGTTIQGSVGAMSAAWTNLVTGFADKNADLEGLINNLVTTIVGDGTENNLGVIGNVLPAVETALVGIGTMIEKAVPVLVEMLPGLLQQILPVLLSSATSLVNSVIEVLPELVDLIVDTLIDNAPMLIVAAVELILALAGGLIRAVPKLLKAIPQIIRETVAGFKESKNIQKFVDVGKNVVSGILSGLKQAWEGLKKWFSNAWSNLVGGVKDFLGIHSPSRVFASIGKNMALGVGEGWDKEFGKIKNGVESSMDFGVAQIGFEASSIKQGFQNMFHYGGFANNDIVLNITESIDGRVLARNQYKYNASEGLLRGNSLVSGVI